jgi:hypothetical protein
MATSEDIVRLNAQFLEILKRIEKESLTLQQVREAFQALITAPHALRNTFISSELGLDQITVDQLGANGIITTLDLTRYNEFVVCQWLVENDGYPMSNQKVWDALDRFWMLRVLMEARGLKFQDDPHTRSELFHMF